MSSLEMLLAAQPAAVAAAAFTLEAIGQGCTAAAQLAARSAPGGEWTGAGAEGCATAVRCRAVAVEAYDAAFRNSAAAIGAYAVVLQEQQQIARQAVARRDAAKAAATQQTARLRAAMAAGQWSAVPPLVSSIQACNRAHIEAVAQINAAVMRVTQAAGQLQGQLLGAGAEFDHDLVQAGGGSAWDSFAGGVGDAVMPEVRSLLAAGRDMWDNFWTLDPRVTPVDLSGLLTSPVMPADQAIAPAARQVSDWLTLAAHDPARAAGQLSAGLAINFGTDGLAALHKADLLSDLGRIHADDVTGHPTLVDQMAAGEHSFSGNTGWRHMDDPPRGFRPDGTLPRDGDLPVHFQGNRPTCGLVSCEMLLEGKGRTVDMEQVLNRWERPGGNPPAHIASVLNQHGISSIPDSGSLNRMMEQQAAKQHPFIAVIKVEGSPAGEIPNGGGLHGVVVDGFTTRYGQDVVAIRNPWGKQYFQLLSEFEKQFAGQWVRPR